jgi:hypothetical protein
MEMVPHADTAIRDLIPVACPSMRPLRGYGPNFIAVKRYPESKKNPLTWGGIPRKPDRMGLTLYMAFCDLGGLVCGMWRFVKLMENLPAGESNLIQHPDRDDAD